MGARSLALRQIALLSAATLIWQIPAAYAGASIRVLHVEIGGTNTSCDDVSAPYGDVQTAVDCAADGDTVAIGSGRFRGGISIPVKDLTVSGLRPARDGDLGTAGRLD